MSSSGHSPTPTQQPGPVQRIRYTPRHRRPEERWRSNSLGNLDQDAVVSEYPAARSSSCEPVRSVAPAPAAYGAGVLLARPDPRSWGCLNASFRGHVQYQYCPCNRCRNASRSIHVSGIARFQPGWEEVHEALRVHFEQYGQVDGIRVYSHKTRRGHRTAQVRFLLESSAVAAVQAAGGTGSFFFLAGQGMLRIGFPFYSRFCCAPGEPTAERSVPAEPSSVADNDGPEGSRSNTSRPEMTVALPAVVWSRPKETRMRLPSAWMTGSVAEKHPQSDAPKTPRSPSNMSSDTSTVVPASADNRDAEVRQEGDLGMQTVVRRPERAGLRLPSSWVNRNLPGQGEASAQVVAGTAAQQPPSPGPIPQPTPKATEPSLPSSQGTERQGKMAVRQQQRANGSGSQSHPPAAPDLVATGPTINQQMAQSVDMVHSVIPEQTRWLQSPYDNPYPGQVAGHHHANHPSFNAQTDYGHGLWHGQGYPVPNHRFPPTPVINPVPGAYAPPPYQGSRWPSQPVPFRAPSPQSGQTYYDGRRDIQPPHPAVHESLRRGNPIHHYSRQDPRWDLGYTVPEGSLAAPSSNFAQPGSISGSYNGYGPPAQSVPDRMWLPIPSPGYATHGSSTGRSASEYLHPSQASGGGMSLRVPSSAYSTYGSSNGPPSSLGPAPSYGSGPPSYHHRTGPPRYHSGPGLSVPVPAPGYAGYGSSAGGPNNGYGPSSHGMAHQVPPSAYTANGSSLGRPQDPYWDPRQTESRHIQPRVPSAAEFASNVSVYGSVTDRSDNPSVPWHSSGRSDHGMPLQVPSSANATRGNSISSLSLGRSYNESRPLSQPTGYAGFVRPPSPTTAVHGSSSGDSESMDISSTQSSDNGRILGQLSPTHATRGSPTIASNNQHSPAAQSGGSNVFVRGSSSVLTTKGSSTGVSGSERPPIPQSDGGGGDMSLRIPCSPANATNGSSVAVPYSPANATHGSSTDVPDTQSSRPPQRGRKEHKLLRASPSAQATYGSSTGNPASEHDADDGVALSGPVSPANAVRGSPVPAAGL